jgi:hypothetical protein
MIIVFNVVDMQYQNLFLSFMTTKSFFSQYINPYHAEWYAQDITSMLNCFDEIS